MNLAEFFSTLILKNQLINCPLDEFKNLYSDDNFEQFLNNIVLLMEYEGAFFLLDESFIQKLDEGLNRDLQINEMIALKLRYIYDFFNKLETEDYLSKKIKLAQYIQYHCDIRGLNFDDINEFKSYLAYDCITLNSIISNDSNYINNYDLFISSLEYLYNIVPEILDVDRFKIFIFNELKLIGEELNIKFCSYKLKIDYKK